MAKHSTVDILRIRTALYEHNKDTLFSAASAMIVPRLDVSFRYDPYGVATFCEPLGKSIADGFKITIGGNMWANSYRPTFTTYKFDKDDAKAVLPQLNSLLRGLFYHELGHLRFTNMLDRQIIDYKNSSLIPAIHTAFNTFEDIVIERFGMSIKYPWTKKYFELLTKNIFAEKASLYKDDGDANSFFNYLLLMLRCGYKEVPNNKVYEDNKAHLSNAIKEILMEPNSSNRITKTIAFVEWLEANTTLNLKMMAPLPSEETPITGLSEDPSAPGAGSGSSTEPPALDSESLGGGSGTTSAKTEDKSGSSGSGVGSSNPFTSGASGRESGASRGRGRGTSGGSEEVFDLDTLTKADAFVDDGSDVGEYLYDSSNDLLIDEDAIVEASFNDILLHLCPHRMIDAKDYYKPRSVTLPRIEQRLSNFHELCLEVATALRVIQTRNKPRMQPGYVSGKLHMRSAINASMSGKTTAKVFQRKIDNGVQPDIAISILCDNSGSMSGNKAYVATNALMALAQACDICSIPLEVAAFTEGRGYNWTIRMKNFNESFETAKIYFGIADSDLLSTYMVDKNIPTFYGNEDEANIYHTWQGFKKNKHKNKILIVISDGETCGSTAGLKKLIQQVSDSGIYVLGLGIQSEAVRDAYPNYKLFDTVDSLNSLPDFLIETLLKFATGGR